jgi:hypothetical protein
LDIGPWRKFDHPQKLVQTNFFTGVGLGEYRGSPFTCNSRGADHPAVGPLHLLDCLGVVLLTGIRPRLSVDELPTTLLYINVVVDGLVCCAPI